MLRSTSSPAQALQVELAPQHVLPVEQAKEYTEFKEVSITQQPLEPTNEGESTSASQGTLCFVAGRRMFNTKQQGAAATGRHDLDLTSLPPCRRFWLSWLDIWCGCWMPQNAL